ncbi:MAG: hypothetical protein WBA88_13880 [Pseudaminobacter sp.]
MLTAILVAAARLLGISPDAAKVIAILIAIAAALGSAWGGYALIKHSGVLQERARIEKENTDAIVKGIATSRSFDECLATRGVWDFRRQRCSSASGGGR